MKADVSQQLIMDLRQLSLVVRSKPQQTMLDEEVRAAHDAILGLLDSVRDPRDVRAILRRPECAQLRVGLTELNASLHRLTEIDLARRYLGSFSASDPFEGSWINKGFSGLLRNQVGRWKTRGVFERPFKGPVLIVGGGALPQTQVTLYRELQCEVISVESDPVSAELCRAVLRRAGYENLRVIEADGATHDYSGAYLVVVATLVPEKHLVARRVAETATDAFFAPRTPVALHSMWREPVDRRRLTSEGWKCLDYYAPTGSSVATMLFAHGVAEAR